MRHGSALGLVGVIMSSWGNDKGIVLDLLQYGRCLLLQVKIRDGLYYSTILGSVLSANSNIKSHMAVANDVHHDSHVHLVFGCISNRA